MRRIIWGLLFVLGSMSAASAQAADPQHWPTRNYITSLQASVLGPGQILLIGDSITETFWWNQLNGHFVVNAGHGGAGIDDARSTASDLLPVVKPHMTLVMVGINDCQVSAPTTDFATWQSKYQTILRNILNAGSKAVAITIPPIESGKSLTSTVNQNCWWNLNQAVIAAATAEAVPWVNANNYFGDPNQSPAYWWMYPGLSYDGIHPFDSSPGSGGAQVQYNLFNYAVTTFW